MVQVNTPITLRVKFFKKGNLQYISHLDLVRTMMKVIVRSKLPLWYTEGFNPKPKVTFAAPLSIGTESECEFMDIRLTERIDPAEALSRLNFNMTEEMQAVKAYYPERKMTELKWLSYDITVNCSSCAAELAESCEKALAENELKVNKKTKSGEAIVDIKPLIKSAQVSSEGNIIKINAVLSADQSAFLNPEYLIKLLRERAGILCAEDLLSESYEILRTGAYLENMSTFE